MPNQWRHISEAPKDGTTLLLWSPPAKYQQKQGDFVAIGQGHTWIGRWYQNGWYSDDGWGDADYFMFLPEPPNIEG